MNFVTSGWNSHQLLWIGTDRGWIARGEYIEADALTGQILGKTCGTQSPYASLPAETQSPLSGVHSGDHFARSAIG